MVLSREQLNPRGTVVGTRRSFVSVSAPATVPRAGQVGRTYLVLARTIAQTTVFLRAFDTPAEAEQFAGFKRQDGTRNVRVERF